MVAIFGFFSWTSLSIAAALSRIAVATPFHLLSWSGVILSASFRLVMRCSTVSGLLLVAAWAAGGLPVVLLLWAAAGSAPARAIPPTSAAAARVRATVIMGNPFLFLFETSGKETSRCRPRLR